MSGLENAVGLRDVIQDLVPAKSDVQIHNFFRTLPIVGQCWKHLIRT